MVLVVVLYIILLPLQIYVGERHFEVLEGRLSGRDRQRLVEHVAKREGGRHACVRPAPEAQLAELEGEVSEGAGEDLGEPGAVGFEFGERALEDELGFEGRLI